jgi:hypothetical protein
MNFVDTSMIPEEQPGSSQRVTPAMNRRIKLREE